MIYIIPVMQEIMLCKIYFHQITSFIPILYLIDCIFNISISSRFVFTPFLKTTNTLPIYYKINIKYLLFYKLKNLKDLNELYPSVKSLMYPLKSHILDNYL